jgi:hypothetical protein
MYYIYYKCQKKFSKQYMKFISFDLLYIYIFYFLLFVLGGLTMKIIYDKMFPEREGLDIGKSITRALNKPFKEIKKGGEKAIGGIKEIKKAGEKAIGGIQKVFKYITIIGKFLGGVFEAIGSYLECSVFYIKNIFSICIVYYLLYILGLVLYSPFAFLFWITGTQYIEKMGWDFLGDINEVIVDISGFNILNYIYPNKCYKCRIKPLPKLKL